MAARRMARCRKGISTLEWIVIAIIALVMIVYVLGYWKDIWGAVTGQAETAKSNLGTAIDTNLK